MLDDISLDNPYLFGLLFVSMWVAIGYFISYAGGWAKLAELYRTQANSFEGSMFHLRSANMRALAHYNNVLTIGSNARGVYLAVLFLFRAGHPPLFIPWEDIEASNEQGILFSCVTFRFVRATGVTLKVSRSLGLKVLEAAGRRASR